MPRSKLFETWSFRLPLPTPFDDPQYIGAKDFGISAYNVSAGRPKATLHASSLHALLSYAKLVYASTTGQDTSDIGALGHQGSTFRIAERYSPNKKDCVIFNQSSGKFIAAQIDNGTDVLKPITIGTGASTGSSFLFCLMPLFDEDSEFHNCIGEFIDQMSAGWTDMDAALKTALTLCDNMYRRIENAANCGSAGIKISIPTTGNISALSQLALDNGTYAPTGTLFGEFTTILGDGGSTAPTATLSVEDFAGKYPLTQRILTQREQAMVPKLPDWYIIPREVVRVCEHALATTNLPSPCVISCFGVMPAQVRRWARRQSLRA